jgi:ABC-type spermidine/putrescine transport system permease subunit I
MVIKTLDKIGGIIRPVISYMAKNKVYLIIPALVYLTIFLFWPLFNVLRQSLFSPALTLEHYRHIFQEKVYLDIIANTVRIGFYVTLLCLLIGFPLAYLITKMRTKLMNYALMLVTLPLWVNCLAIIYAWMLLLQRQGLINLILGKIGISKMPFQMMYNLAGLLICMVYLLLPYMVLPIIVAINRLDWKLVLAARNLGASKIQSFIHIIIPLVSRGIAAGCLIVFVLSLGFFVAPALLGSRHETMIAIMINSQVNTLLDWGFASALAVILFLTTIVVILLGNSIFKIGTFVFSKGLYRD